MAILEQTFRAGRETVHAVLLKQSSKLRWNAFLWGSNIHFANSFARRQNAERWLADLLRRYFPSVDFDFPTQVKNWCAAAEESSPLTRPRNLARAPVYRGS